MSAFSSGQLLMQFQGKTRQTPVLNKNLCPNSHLYLIGEGLWAKRSQVNQGFTI